jgi:branched-subunit amino acid aminotransferase/4-amino-4-deoxychorismate lyase
LGYNAGGEIGCAAATKGGIENMNLRHFQLEDLPELAESFVRPYHRDYFAMYSSVLGGVVSHPFLMMVPVDDHMVHRGDGVFETIKCVNGSIYGLERHLDRLERSARAIYLQLSFSRTETRDVICETIRHGGQRDCLIRLLVSRGPGGFTVNPYECPKSQLYVIISRLHVPTEEEYDRGVSLKSSGVPPKKPYFATVKSCNYLQNVLMKKEAVDAGVDYTVALDEQGFMAEGASENMAIVTHDRTLKLPSFARILKGTTVMRALEMAEEPAAQKVMAGIVFGDITLGEAYSSEEILILGTSFNVLAAVRFDGQPVGSGKPGPVFRFFHERFKQDVRGNPAMLTPAFG